MFGSVGENSCSGDCVSLSLGVIGVVVVYELFARELFADAAVVDALFIRAGVDGAGSRSPERFSFQRITSCASRLFLPQIVLAMPTVCAANSQ